MATDPVLRMLGLARRAGKLAYGDELVREACFDHKTRCVFIAGDAGANAAKKAAFYADKANVPCVTLPHGVGFISHSVFPINLYKNKETTSQPLSGKYIFSLSHILWESIPY